MLPSQTPAIVTVSANDLPLHCPTPSSPLWSAHPRVYLDIAKTGKAACPYCGTVYQLTGPAPSGH